MKRATIAILSATVMVAGCSGGTSAPANNEQAAVQCQSTPNNPTYSGFSADDVSSLIRTRGDTLKASPDDQTAWNQQATDFAKQFLDKISIAPDSLCGDDFKDIQTLMGAEMDLESRADKGKPGTLTGDTLQRYVRILYQTAGLTAQRGYSRLDQNIDYTMKAVARTRESWNK